VRITEKPSDEWASKRWVVLFGDLLSYVPYRKGRTPLRRISLAAAFLV